MNRPPGRPRVVFDCNAFVQAIAFDNSPACEAFRLAETGHLELFVSKATLSELRRVLEYEEVLAISPNISFLKVMSHAWGTGG